VKSERNTANRKKEILGLDPRIQTPPFPPVWILVFTARRSPILI
jgi:hypothetical protein